MINCSKTISARFRARLLAAAVLGLASPQLASADEAIINLASSNAAQPFPGDAVVSASQPAANQGLDPADLAALYYYAKERQSERVEAEILRLQALHPGFVPPSDLYAPKDQQRVDESGLWQLYAKADFDGVDREIERLQAESPGWTPSEDFTSKLARKQLRVGIEQAVKLKDWTGLLSAAKDIDPANEPEIDLIWKMADASSALGDKESAIADLRAILGRQGDARPSDEFLTVTVQKALGLLPETELRAAIDRLWPAGTSSAARARVESDLARAEIGHFNASEAEVVAPEAAVALLSANATNGSAPKDAALLGWYHIKLKAPEKAEPYFRTALAADADAQNAKGLYLSLSRQGKDKEAEEFVASHLDELKGDPLFLANALAPRFSGELRNAVVDEQVVAAYSQAVMDTEDAGHAGILGWYAYNSGQFEASEAWFRKAYEWKADADPIKGLALSFLHEKKTRSFSALKAEFVAYYPDIWPEIEVAPAPKVRAAVSAVSAPAKSQPAAYLRAFEAKNYSACLASIDKLGASSSRPNVQLIAGWCHMGLGRIADARGAFQRAMAGSGSVRQDAIYGNALALLRSKLTDEADALISAYPVSAARERELRTEIYTQQALSAYKRNQYVRVIQALDARAAMTPETRDLMQLRGWAYHKAGYESQARAVFTQLDQHMNDASVRSYFNSTQ